MKALLDTSVLIAAMVEAHPFHLQALPWLQRIKKQQIKGVVASHTLVELYAVLTSLPVRPRISPGAAWRLVRENVLEVLEVIVLSKADYRAVLESLSENQISGGATYDALIARAAVKARVDRLVTLNPVDFQRVAPELSELVSLP